MTRFFLRAAIASLGLWLASTIVPGFGFDSGGWLIIAALVLGVVNAVVRPVLIVLTLPVTIVTLGLFLLVVNALMIALVAWLVPGFHVAGFGAAFWASIVVSLVSWAGWLVFGPKGGIQISIRRL
jgi:putative membrane protein